MVNFVNFPSHALTCARVASLQSLRFAPARTCRCQFGNFRRALRGTCGVACLAYSREGWGMTCFRLFITIGALCASSAAAAQAIDVHAGRVIDPASGKVLADQRIRIVDGKFAGLSPWRGGDGPAAVDWSGYTVLPGLIDLHTHLADGAIGSDDGDPAGPLKPSQAD